MSGIEALEKLRESSHLDDDKWTLEDGGVVYMCGSMPNDPNAVNWGEQWREIADEIEAEVERDFIRLPVGADGAVIRLGDRFEHVVPSEGLERKIGRVKSITYNAKYYGTWDIDNPTVLVNGLFEAAELKHAYDDSLLRIYEDACCGRVDFDGFARRVAENVEYAKANAGLFASRDELIEMTE